MYCLFYLFFHIKFKSYYLVSNIAIDTSIQYSIVVQDGVTDATIDLTTSSSLGPVGVKNLTDDTKNLELLTYSHPSASSTHEATVVDQGGIGSIQSEDGHFIDGKIAGQVCAIFSRI